MSALIGALRASLSLETAQFEAGARRAQRTNAGLHGSFKKTFLGSGGVAGIMAAGIKGLVAGLSIGLFTKGIKAALDYAGSLGEVAQQLGVTTRDLQVFRFAAGQVGIKQEELEKGLGRLTITLGQVAAGARAPAKALDAIGLSVKDLAGLDTGAAFRKIADGLEKIPDRAQRAAVEVALFGRAGGKLDNLLAGGSGAINELSIAAEKLGIVLSDEQIAKADETADKLDALKTVLSARIAGVVADNADSILGLATALGDLVSSIGAALNAWRQMRAEFNSGFYELLGMEQQAARARGSNFQSGRQPTVPGRSVTVSLAPAKTAKPAPSGGNISQFLGGGGGRKRGGSDDAERKRLEALRDAHQLDQEMLRAQTDILRAQQDLAVDYSERATIAVQILDLERAGYKADLEYEVAAKEKTKAQADALLALYDQKDSLERQAIMADERERAQADGLRLDEVTRELDRNRLESEAQLAETASEQRDVQLRLLDLAYRQERARLEAVIADEQSSYAAKEEARRRIQGLGETYGNDREAVMQGTRGPWEDYLAGVPDTAAKMEEALQQVKANGVDALVDGLTDAAMGVRSLGDVFRQVAQQIIADLIRIQIQKMLVSALGNAFGGAAGAGAVGMANGGTIQLPGFAAGGSMMLGGIGGRDRNLLALNGLPIARVSRGETLKISPNSGPSGMTIHAPITIQGNASRETVGQMEGAMRRAVANAARR